MVFWEKCTDAMHHSYHILSRVRVINVTYFIWLTVDFDIDLDHLTEGVSVRFLHFFFPVKGYSFFSINICNLWKEVTLYSRDLCSTSWGQSIHINWNSAWESGIFSPIYLFIRSFIFLCKILDFWVVLRLVYWSSYVLSLDGHSICTWKEYIL